MSSQKSNEFWLRQLTEHLKQQRYSPQAFRRRVLVAGRFLAYLKEQHVAVEIAGESNVSLYLQKELRHFRRYHGRGPRNGWRRSHTAGIHMLLRLAQGKWPPAPVASNLQDAFHREICGQYDEWMRDFCGLGSETRLDRYAEAHRFLVRLGERGSNRQNLLNITIADIDAYMAFRAESHRRSSLCNFATNLRSLLRYLHATGRIVQDLSTAVTGPTLYAFESIPSSLRLEDVRAVVKTTREDRTQMGLRDYAILMLLSSYGLRAGEITSLRLEDVNWRSDVLRIHHSKTGVHSELPLSPAVGNAILDYLLKGRPKTQAREIFIVGHAPYRPFKSGSSLYWLVRHRLAAAGVNPAGKRGPHALRHARAVSMLRAAVPAKEIGDILGHRSAQSTATYLKLATEDLRAVALEIPEEVNI